MLNHSRLFRSVRQTDTAADQADLLRRELDNRFLDRAGLAGALPPSPYLRQELHHHQHQHTHLHQHQQLLPGAPPAPAPLFPPPPMFKDMPKMVGGSLGGAGLVGSIGGVPGSMLGGSIGGGGVIGGGGGGGTVGDSSFYRTGALGLPGAYPNYGAPGMLHAGLGGPTPFVPPSHLPSFAPKVSVC